MKPSENSQAFLSAVSVEEMRAYDAYTIANLVPGRQLMYRAAMGVFHAISWQGKRIVIVAGSGNNGGDGYALATILAGQGIFPTIVRTSEHVSEDGGYYFAKCVEQGIHMQPLSADTDFGEYDVIVDCILGTGFQGTPRGNAALAIEKINAASACAADGPRPYVVSVDINSGMNGDTGEAELAVKSHKTVSIGFYKRGQFLGKAPSYIGDLINVDIGIVKGTKEADE